MKLLLSGLLFLVSFSLFSQENATTDSGKKVKLYSNGYWEYMEENTGAVETSNVFLNGKQLTSGITEYIHSKKDEFGAEVSISVTIAKDNTTTYILFWQETTDLRYNNIKWIENATLFLENGETITLIDRNISGNNIIENYSYYNKETDRYKDTDLYQSFIAYYLSNSDIAKLKQSDLSRIAYQSSDFMKNGTLYLTIQNNNSTIKNQLKALGL